MRIDNMQSLDASFRSLYRTAKLMLENGKMVLAEVTEFKPRRTKAQNDYYWEYCTQVAKFLTINTGGYTKYKLDYDKDLIHKIHKKKLSIDTTRKMSIQEFCNFMYEIDAFWITETEGAFQMSETPENYLHRKGY